MRNENPGTPWSLHVQVWLAQGVLAEQLGLTVEDADRALRTHAEQTGTALRAVADDVVAFSLFIQPGDYC